MFKFLKALVFCVKNFNYVNKVVEETKKKEEQDKKRKEERRLHLCENHNPVEGLTNYDRKNCDFCKLHQYLGPPKIIPHHVMCKFY